MLLIKVLYIKDVHICANLFLAFLLFWAYVIVDILNGFFSPTVFCLFKTSLNIYKKKFKNIFLKE